MKFVIASSVGSRLRGLAGKADEGCVLVLAPCHDIHTYTMRRPIDVAFVSGEGVVLASYRGVAPRRRLRNGGAAVVLERYAEKGRWFEEGERVAIAPLLPVEEGVSEQGMLATVSA